MAFNSNEDLDVRHREPIQRKDRSSAYKKFNSYQSKKMVCGRNHPLIFWDCSGISRVPAVEKAKKLHVYDFDNTLFRSPSPNPNLFNESTVGTLSNSEMLANGGWWSYPLVLKNAVEGLNSDEWESFWNHDIVDLLNSSNDDEETITIIMTGRKNHLFGDLLKAVIDTKELKYDALILKQGHFNTTLSFKSQVLIDILEYYTHIDEIVLYDDRKSQLNGFQDCLNEYIAAVRPSLIYSLVPVYTQSNHLKPKVERQLVEEYLEDHNSIITSGSTDARLGRVSLKKSFFYTAYLIDNDHRAHLTKEIISILSDDFDEETISNYKFQIDYIPITKSKLSKTAESSLNSTISWKVSEIGHDDKYIALRVEPEDPNITTRTQTTPAILPVASKGKSSASPPEEFLEIQNWKPVNKLITFETFFGQKVSFRISADVRDGKRKKKGRPTGDHAV